MVVGTEFDAFGLHLRQTAVDHIDFQLEVGNAVTQQATDAVVFLEHHHAMTRPRQLLGASQPGGTGTDHGHALAGAVSGDLRHHPAFSPTFVDDGALDILDRHRLIVEVQGT